MLVTIKGPVFEVLRDELVRLGIVELDEDGNIVEPEDSAKRHKWNKRWGRKQAEGTVDLSSLTKKECEKLCKMLETCGVHGTRVAAADIKKYLKAASEGIDGIRARTCRQAAWMLEFFFGHLPNKIIFSKDEYGGKSHSGYYVDDVQYVPPDESRGRQSPEFTSIQLWWIENDHRRSQTLTLYRDDCQERNCLEILAHQGYVPESPELMAKLKEETERYFALIPQIGKQHMALGCGLPDLDDDTERESRSYWNRRREIQLDHFGHPARVVIDVFKETDKGKDDKGESTSGSSPDPYRWHNWNLRFHTPSEEELVRHLEADDDTAEPVIVEIPVHPLVPCFDLTRHLRLRVHVNNLTPYRYNKSVSERLVLPERDWKMVNLLVDHSSNDFEDIVANKGRSMNILAVGPPGTGKTATSEVFAEFKERPLYTIQCSQLGMQADEVEKNLGVVMRRANRWNAVLLLDEADVYIRKRGTDLQQNAIVGAFLRVLEYASCILFMTSNLGDQVDDAITSRCIAKLTYDVPSPEDQARIWKILAKLNKLEISDGEVSKVIKAHPRLSGRDVKNLLKLASFAHGSKLDAKAIEYAIQFKPTEDFSR